MKARLKTVGVEEYHFVMDGVFDLVATEIWLANLWPGSEGGGDWYIYDVGGSRSLVSVIMSVSVYFRHTPVYRTFLVIFVGKINSRFIALTKRICGCSFQRSQWASFFDDGECRCSPSPGVLLSQTAHISRRGLFVHG